MTDEQENFHNLKIESPAETESEYWRLHKKFTRHITKMSVGIHRFVKDPTEYINKYKELLSEGVRLNLITEEYKQEKIDKFYKEMTSPSRFTEDMKNKMMKARDKFRKKQKDETKK